ncbi:response regulator [Sporosarcina aquimarina]|uniref:Response regulator n=1 Tax=Sporosarcina aquimarina TaxID=114975 RepID=A0ABU4FYK3_9BACL|nr:response regulator [Sporosarcina aquimarina]MDW0109806.1 response regulator [Sporosarcina aquimarina]
MIRAILVDDEQLALKQLTKQLVKTNEFEVIASYSNATDVLKNMRSIQFDVAFLDIEMPGMSGLDLADLILDWNEDILIVFVTAYRDYAVQAFELRSTDYLLKPILLERLLKTTDRLREELSNRRKESGDLLLKQNYTLSITCFKEFNVYYKTKQVKWKTAKVKELFAYFITHVNNSIHRDVLINALWPEVEYKRAKVQLHTTLSYLRSSLDCLGYPEAIKFAQGSYTMQLAEFHSDAQQFEQYFMHSPIVTTQTIDQSEQLLLTYTGDYLEETGYEWATTKANSLRQLLLHSLQSVADYFSVNCHPSKKQHYLQRLIAADPYSDYATRQLIQFHIDTGNRGEALRVFHDLKDLLMSDLGIMPDSLTMELYTSLLE